MQKKNEKLYSCYFFSAIFKWWLWLLLWWFSGFKISSDTKTRNIPTITKVCLHFLREKKKSALHLQKGQRTIIYLSYNFTQFRWPMETEVERFTVADVYNPPATTTWKPPTFIKQTFEKPTNPFNFETIREDSRIR